MTTALEADDTPDFSQESLSGVRDGLRSARFWRELLTDADRQAMLLDVARISLLIAGDLQDKPYQDGDISGAAESQTGVPPCPLERLAFLQAAWPLLENALVHIEANPPAVLQSQTRWTETERARCVRPKDVLLALRTGGESGGLVPAPNAVSQVPLARRLHGNLPRRVPETVAVSSTDTPVNRATKAVIARISSDLKTIALRAQEASLPQAAREAERLHRRVRKRLMTTPLWRDLPSPRTGLHGHVLRAQLLPPSFRASWPHRRIHDTFRDYSDRFALNWEQPLFLLPAQKTWLLYEIWCVFAFANLLRDLDFRPKNEDNWIAFGPQGLSSRLATDRASRLVFVHQETGQTVTLTYNRYFGRGEEESATGWHSRGRALRPDIALEAAEKILVLDAKWKTYREPGWEGDDIRQMHSYRDAIAFGPFRNVVPSAWLLYPGAVQPETRRPVIAYPAASPNAPFGNTEVGALCVRPGTDLTGSPLARLVSGFLAGQNNCSSVQ